MAEAARAGEQRAGLEPGAGGQRALLQRDGVDRLVEFQPEEIAAARNRPARAADEVPLQRRLHRVAARAVGRAQAVEHRLLQAEFERMAHHLRHVVVDRAAAVDETGLQHPVHQFRRGLDPAEPQRRRHDLGEGAERQDVALVDQRGHRRRRRLVEVQHLVDLVGGDDEAVAPAERGQFAPPFGAQRDAAGVLVARDRVDQRRAPLGQARAKDVHAHAVVVHRDADHVEPVVGEDAVGQEIGRLLDEHRVARLREARAGEVQRLRVAAADQQVFRPRRVAVMAREKVRERGAVAGVALAFAVVQVQRLRRGARHEVGRGGAQGLDRHQVRAGLADAEMDHVRRGDGVESHGSGALGHLTMIPRSRVRSGPYKQNERARPGAGLERHVDRRNPQVAEG